MAVVTLAVDIPNRNEETPEPLWMSLLCFGKLAGELMRHFKGDLVSVSGNVQRNSYINKTTGERVSQLQIIADSIISARTVRPGGRPKVGSAPENAKLPFDDDLAFLKGASNAAR
jgi:single-stranded DNA-binding protein